jgi:hypothetical protein
VTDIQPAPMMPTAPVTLLDIYTRQVEMGGTLGVIQERLTAIPDHESRIRRLEALSGKLIGAAVAVSTIVSGLGTWLGVILTRH